MSFTENYRLPGINRDLEIHLSQLRLATQKVGFSFLKGEQVSRNFEKEEINDFRSYVANLPFESIGNTDLIRQRCVGYAHLYARNELLYFLYPDYDPISGLWIYSYNLPYEINPDFKGKRNYVAVNESLIGNQVLHSLISIGYAMSSLNDDQIRMPLEVEIQFIKYVPRHGVDAISTPDTVHQDNDWAFCIFLISRENVEGGTNSFVRAEYAGEKLSTVESSGIIASHTLSETFDGFSVDDTKVAHHVAPVALKHGSATGERTILILSYKPLIPSRPELSSSKKKTSQGKFARAIEYTKNNSLEQQLPLYAQKGYWF